MTRHTSQGWGGSMLATQHGNADPDRQPTTVPRAPTEADFAEFNAGTAKARRAAYDKRPATRRSPLSKNYTLDDLTARVTGYLNGDGSTLHSNAGALDISPSSFHYHVQKARRTTP